MPEATELSEAPVFSKAELRPPVNRPLVSVKDILWLVYLYPIRYLAKVLPIRFVRLIGRAAEPLFQYHHRMRRVSVETDLCIALGIEQPTDEVRRVARRFVHNAVVRAIDDLIVDKLAAGGGLRCEAIHGEQNLKQALASGRGVVVVSGHFYANRVAKRYLAERGYQLTSLRKTKPLDRLMGRLGARYLQHRYIEFLHGVIRDEIRFEDADVSLQLLRKLRAGGVVNVHIDVISYREHLELPFLGRRRGFATGMMEVIRLSGCAVVPMICVGDSQGFTVTFEEPIDLEPAATRNEYAITNLPKLVRRLEAQVYANPDQWEHWRRL